MKKQFFRVKQLADQTFSRAGKTNALSDDLQDADRKTEYIRNACQNVAKKMSACLLLGSVASDANIPFKDRKDKALKKSPEHALAVALKECSANCDNDSPLRVCLEACAVFEQFLVDDNIERDALVESEVVAHFQALLDNEIPSIHKHKRNVNKLCLDMDSAKARFIQASKHSGNTPAGSAKAESVKEELEDCEAKLEQSRDVLASEMFQFIVREADMCRHLLDFYKYRKAYYQNALIQLDSLIPRLETVAGDSSVSKVYGTRLEDHLRVTGRKIAYPIELFVCALLELGMEEEGLFRLAGGASKVKRMKLSLDAGCMTLATALTYRDPHIISGCLKSYLRDLPEPLLTFALYEEWLDAVKTSGSETNRLELLRQVIQKLPNAQYDNLRYLIRFFHLLSKNQETNKMSPQNLAIVLAPNLIWLGDDSSGISLNALNATSHYARIVELLVTNCETLFPGEMEFYITLEPLINGDHEGIDNKGFDPRTDGGLKRSQSVNSLTDDPPDSPKPVMRKKNKPVAPTPPVEKEKEKPPRPSPVITTLPRPGKSHASTNTEDIMTRSVDEVLAKTEPEVELRQKNDVEIKSKTSTGTSPRQDTRSAKEVWLQGKPALPERPVIPERPAALKPTPKLRTTLDGSKNYENVSMSSSENLSGDERSLQRTQLYSIEKQQVEYIKVSDKKRGRSREKRSKERDRDTENEGPEPETQVNHETEEEDNPKPLEPGIDSTEAKRPTSLTGLADKPERPPKPDHFTSSPSHTRTLSDGQIIDKPKPKRDLNANEGLKPLVMVKHPSTSPPPPPVPAKPRAISQDESTDF